MKAVPFGEVRKERIEISKKYKLIEVVNGIWRLTQKCKNNYDYISYFSYLQGKVEIPKKKTDPQRRGTLNREKKVVQENRRGGVSDI